MPGQWEDISMKASFWIGTALAALLAGGAVAQELKFAPGQDSKFNWKSYEDFKAAHANLKGQNLTLFGPWRGEDEVLFNSVLAYFNAATGTARGHEFLYWHESEKGQKMATFIENNFKRWIPEQNARGAKSRTASDRGGAFLQLTKCPAVICEPGFGDNKQDWEFLRGHDYEIAGCIAQALKEAIT